MSTCRSVKDETPGAGVAIAQGQPDAHWQPAGPERKLFLNIESLWDDYEAAVDHFIDACGKDEALRTRALTRWPKRQWTVQLLQVVDPNRFALIAAQASASSSVTSAVDKNRLNVDELYPPPD